MNEMRKLMEAVESLYDNPETELHKWFERDRAHIELRNAETDETIIEWWDEEVHNAFDLGILDPQDIHASAIRHAKNLDLI